MTRPRCRATTDLRLSLCLNRSRPAAWVGRALGAAAIAALPLLASSAAVATEHADAKAPAGFAERRVVAMGTAFDLRVRGATRERALAASEAAVAEVERLEALLSTWRPDTPLARVNRVAPGKDVPVDAELATVLGEVFAWSARTRGAFDPTVAPLVRAWDLRGEGRVPSGPELAAARVAVGVRRFRLDPAASTIARLDAGAGIDEGAWGKGYALDRAAARLRETGADAALLDFGGEVLAMGADADAPWRIELAHPRERSRPVVAIALPPGAAVSTSGNSERSRRAGDRVIGHLLDPGTGEPAPDFGSVAVVARSGLAADVLSTAFFVLGPDAGLALSAALRAGGTWNESLFLVESGGRLSARASPGWSALVVSASPEVLENSSSRPCRRFCR